MWNIGVHSVLEVRYVKSKSPRQPTIEVSLMKLKTSSLMPASLKTWHSDLKFCQSLIFLDFLGASERRVVMVTMRRREGRRVNNLCQGPPWHWSPQRGIPHPRQFWLVASSRCLVRVIQLWHWSTQFGCVDDISVTFHWGIKIGIDQKSQWRRLT